MYKVFVNDKPLFLTSTVEKETDFQTFLLDGVDIEQLVTRMFSNKVEKAHLYHPDEKLILKKLKEKIPVAKAGGGLVYNKKGEILFILRNGKWDLPKGGIEKGEDIEETAMREVEEETGAKNLVIVQKLQKTYHIFKRNGNYKLKITHWFEMISNHRGALTPQANEGIEKAVWLKPDEVKEALKNSYENIKLLFEEQHIKEIK
ncbi:NUDIX hydrolase [Flavobacterium akiainvivens]|uniref:NUDIX hydrolase n=1 Tax=Flavobacterium akiainvivens TaxID=1202724 RepID=A0A0M8MAN8_9FLAO|nr:NUDIX domain-containing protein [Flavobacterium akiainvivens]KOS04724.1 NUDIX hydrolase [Flavobacterium akiainvivens]SFQ67009.1 NUDIX domain-containing protein [Flavobacterium akiainvivens]